MPLPALDFSFFAVAIPAVMFAGISKGGFGSGAAFASAAILALVLAPGAAIGIMVAGLAFTFLLAKVSSDDTSRA